ncbi:hypothetical protein MES4922_130112 [Mesorhizobium ventifaucium]|uniref:Secreted protein n=1 Tax=Mesorhizobium ventifaucium TaxID=666020 RepID=A0ABN8JC80_9HYPH|nr:hypothetical protein MES4922_130112 [Mesorhizobium ventifaucium]
MQVILPYLLNPLLFPHSLTALTALTAPTPLLPYCLLPTAYCLLPTRERLRRHAVVRALWKHVGSCCSGPSWPPLSRRSALDHLSPMSWNRLLG